MVSAKQTARIQVLRFRSKGWTPGHIFAELKRQARAAGSEPAASKRTIARWCEDIDSDPTVFSLTKEERKNEQRAKQKKTKAAPRSRLRKDGTRLSARDRSRAIDYLETHGNLRKAARGMATDLDLKMSKSTLHRETKRVRMKPVHPSRKQKLPRWLMKERKECAEEKEHINWNAIVFTDFKSFSLDGSYNSHNAFVWRKEGSKKKITRQPKPKYAVTYRVFGALTSKGALPLVEVSETLNARGAQLVLQATLPQLHSLLGEEYILEFDHDPVFTAEPTQEWLQDNVYSWWTPDETPVRSPDFWPIENVWARMSGLVHDAHPRNKEELAAAVHAAWAECTKKVDLDKFYQGMPRRMRAIIEARGAMTKY